MQLTSQAVEAAQPEHGSALPADQVERLVGEFMTGGRISVPLIHVRQVNQALREHDITPVSYT